MTWLLRLLLVAFLAVPVLVGSGAAPAHACSCAGGGVKSYVRWSDAVFVATLDDGLHAGMEGSVESSATVGHVYDGDVPDVVTISTNAQGSACGLTGLSAGETWLFYAAANGSATFAVGSCGGSTRVGSSLLPEVERVLGPGPLRRRRNSLARTGSRGLRRPGARSCGRHAAGPGRRAGRRAGRGCAGRRGTVVVRRRRSTARR